MAFNVYLHDVFTRHQVYIERVKTGQTNEADPLLNDIARILRQALGSLDVETMSELNAVQLRSFLAGLQKKLSPKLVAYQKLLKEFLQEIADYETEFTAEALRQTVADKAAINAAKAGAAYAAAINSPMAATGELLSAYVDKIAPASIDRINQAIRVGVADGLSIQEMRRALVGTSLQDITGSTLELARKDINTIVRTATQQVVNSARQTAYAANADLTDKYRYIATLDRRTSRECKSLDNRVFTVGKGPVPPRHPNCRSTIVLELPASVELSRLAKRASSEGATKAQQTYYDWLGHQTKEFQDDALGSTMAQVFRKGGLSAEKFARLNLDKNFKPLTIAEMRRKAPQVFEKAGV